jgi:hypothetical protein
MAGVCGPGTSDGVFEAAFGGTFGVAGVACGSLDVLLVIWWFQTKDIKIGEEFLPPPVS